MPQAFGLSQKLPKAKLPCRFVRPHQRNPNYVGRAETQLKIWNKLAPRTNGQKGQCWYALCGLGGVGKTQAALNFVFEYMDHFQALLWTHADTRAKLLEDFTAFAVELGLIEEGDSNLTGRDLLKRWFEQARKESRSVIALAC